MTSDATLVEGLGRLVAFDPRAELVAAALPYRDIARGLLGRDPARA